MAINNNGAGGVQELHVISMQQPGGSFQRPAANDHSAVNLAAVARAPADGDSLWVTVTDINSGRMVNLSPSSASAHEIGKGQRQSIAVWILQFTILVVFCIGDFIWAATSLQAIVRPPIVQNIYKALGFQYIIDAIPVIVLTFVGYWAYGNNVNEYLLYSTSGPTWLVTVANVVAFLQILVTIHNTLAMKSSSANNQFAKRNRP
ncbi:unnamed protein product [Sphagnum tenellum]